MWGFLISSTSMSEDGLCSCSLLFMKPTINCHSRIRSQACDENRAYCISPDGSIWVRQAIDMALNPCLKVHIQKIKQVQNIHALRSSLYYISSQAHANEGMLQARHADKGNLMTRSKEDINSQRIIHSVSGLEPGMQYNGRPDDCISKQVDLQC